MPRPADLPDTWTLLAAAAVLRNDDGSGGLRLATFYAPDAQGAEDLAFNFWSARAPIVSLVVMLADP